MPRIERTIENREALVEGDIAAAEKARDATHRIQAAYDAGLEGARADAGRLLADARASAAQATEAELKAAAATDEARTAEAMARVDARMRRALAEIEATTVDAAEAIVAKLSGVGVDRAAVAAQVKAVAAHG